MLDADNTKAISLAEFGRFFREFPLRAQAANLAAVAAAGAPVVTRRATSFAPRAARRASASNLTEGLVSPVRSACLSKTASLATPLHASSTFATLHHSCRRIIPSPSPSPPHAGGQHWSEPAFAPLPAGFPPERRKSTGSRAVMRSNAQTMMRCRSTPCLGSATSVPSEWLGADGSPLLPMTSTVVKGGLSEPARRGARSSKHGRKHARVDGGSGRAACHMEDYAGDAEPGNLKSGSGNLRSQLGGQLVMQETAQETRGPRSSYLATLEKSASSIGTSAGLHRRS